LATCEVTEKGSHLRGISAGGGGREKAGREPAAGLREVKDVVAVSIAVGRRT
jgi:hypothetical protein